ncbi:MAG: glycosyl transferase [Dictyoglomus sp. NZ13-RE01]|nr:MAG: glycosyl transferase [Dictyoglomus sp. NZ13-RE01]
MKITVNLISEALAWDVKGQGVYTASLSLAEALKRVPELEVHINGKGLYDIAHLHTPGPYAITKGLTTGKRIVISAHVIPESLIGSLVLSEVWLPIAEKFFQYYYNLADVIIAVSPKVKSALEEFKVKAPIYVIPNPINLERFFVDLEKREIMRKRLGFTEDDFVVMSSGQIQPRKGVDTFIEVAKHLPDIKFLWVGGQPFSILTAGYLDLQEKIKNAPNNVIFTGIVPYEEMPYYYNASDVLFFPSRQETFGMVIPEAASCGLPLLLRDLEEYKDLYKDWYISANSNDEFVMLIKKLKEDKTFYTEYRNKAFQLAEYYNLNNIGREIAKLYKEILDSPPRYNRDLLTLESFRKEGRKIWKFFKYPKTKNHEKNKSKYYF